MGEDTAEPPEVPATGRELAGRYRIGRLLREGGMGSVYEGVHTETGRKVALKLVHLRSPVHEELENRFEREARIASNVKSKHIVQIFDAGRDPVLGPFMAMELLEGEDLETRLARTGALPARTVCEIAFQAARGLEKAHAANIAHRDLKPGNLFLVDSDEDGFLVKVLDFGIAKLFEGELEGNARLTREGSALGTPLYMSPEQARGKQDIDARSDVYSLGAAMYEAIVGRTHVPELENYNQLVIHIATVPAPRLSASMPTIDPRIDRLVNDMLHSDRRERVQTMRLVRERLAAILGTSRASVASIADTSGSFAQAQTLPPPPPQRPSERSFPALCESDDGEGIAFFDRASLSQMATARTHTAHDAHDAHDAEDAPPESVGEAVGVFDRSSIRMALAEAHARTSSSSHVVDLASLPRSVPPPSIPAPGAPPRVAPPPPARPEPRRAWVTAAIVAGVFVLVGSIRHASSPSDSLAPAAAAQPIEAAPMPVDQPITTPEVAAPVALADHDSGTATDAAR
jgi:serine/threonine protein kinase